MEKNILKASPELAIDIAVQTTRLFIALATSMLAFTVAFSKEFNNGVVTCSMKTSWIFLSISIIAGVFVLQKIIGELTENEKVSLYQSPIKYVALVQNIFFILGVLLVASAMLIK